MHRVHPIALALLLATSASAASGCKSKTRPREVRAIPPPTTDAKSRCTELPFADSIPLAEASGATYLPAFADADERWMVVADSGNHGMFTELALNTGAVLAKGRLPLGTGASDDLEGFSFREGILFGITSSGWMRHWQSSAQSSDGRYRLVRDPYPLAPQTSELVCKLGTAVNCRANFEGLCLTTSPVKPGACMGFAVSKSNSTLYCLVRDANDPNSPLHLEADQHIEVPGVQSLTGCHFDPAGEQLWVGSNLFGGNAVFRVHNWRDPREARIETYAALGRGFPEAIAVGPKGLVLRLSDTGGTPSLANLYRCE